uniref:RING-type E3 ubiquitin transferase n=1 Tax=Kalanchoe fedtschenkoi TaxID=63787 RepID=A0A7N0TYM7_KALFE
MATPINLPCDGDGVCMVCKRAPSDDEVLRCKTCATPWHGECLAVRPASLAETLQWECPDCLMISADPVPAAVSGSGVKSDVVAAIRAIEGDASLTQTEKARRRQEVLSGGVKTGESGEKGVVGILDGSLNCSFCMQLLERPVTTPCGHNFCLKCFQKWVGQGKRTCVNCRATIPPKMASQPRINDAIVVAIRLAKMAKSNVTSTVPKIYQFVHNQNRPDKAYTTERAKKAGKANACSGKIFVTVPADHFGPIPPENDPERNTGVLVGESWEDRMECRQWGTHLPHVAGIAGQSDYGAQSVALSGGYLDDEDHGEWFLYTGSGGRDLSGNKRTNKEQSFDQKFDKMNEALRVSCLKGYPVRVVRSYKEKRSSYAPQEGVRYDGVYRIEKCWRKQGMQGFKVCRYLFVRCDNEPAPWTSDVHGDRPRPLPKINELTGATDITERKGSPSWDYDEEIGSWVWKKPPPLSKKPLVSRNPNEIDDVKEDNGQEYSAYLKEKNKHQKLKSRNLRDKLLKQFNCLICRNLMVLPLTTPCAHNFCKKCLEDAFAGQAFIRQRVTQTGRTLRAQKNIMKCPCCPNDISDFLENPQVQSPHSQVWLS